MKKLCTLLTLVLLMAVGANAQAPKPFNLYLGAGVTMPTGDVGDVYGMGFHGAGAVGFAMGPMFELMPKAEFHAFSLKDEAFPGESIDGGNISVILIGADAKLNFSMPASPMKPFVLGGVGIAMQSQGELKLDGVVQPDVDSESDLYFEFGGGLEFGSGPAMKFFVMARYLSIQTEGQSSNLIPITAGIKF